MDAKEYYLEPFEDNADLREYSDEEAEETLSLSDLPIYNDAAELDHHDFSKDDQTSSDDQDFFEFYREDSTASTCPADEQNNIIFCGKLIPYKQPITESNQKKLQNDTVQYPKKQGSFQSTKTKSFNKSKTPPSVKDLNHTNNPSKLNQKLSNSKSLALTASESYRYQCTAGKIAGKYDISVQKVSTLSPPAKSRWNLLMFGLMRLPTEMELSDMRHRQQRRTQSSTALRSVAGAGGSGSEEVTVGKKSSSRGKGIWRLLKAIGCRNQTANAVVKASFGCIPSV